MSSLVDFIFWTALLLKLNTAFAINHCKMRTFINSSLDFRLSWKCGCYFWVMALCKYCMIPETLVIQFTFMWYHHPEVWLFMVTEINYYIIFMLLNYVKVSFWPENYKCLMEDYNKIHSRTSLNPHVYNSSLHLLVGFFFFFCF